MYVYMYICIYVICICMCIYIFHHSADNCFTPLRAHQRSSDQLNISKDQIAQNNSGAVTSVYIYIALSF